MLLFTSRDSYAVSDKKKTNNTVAFKDIKLTAMVSKRAEPFGFAKTFWFWRLSCGIAGCQIKRININQE
jgi:hypothetical protein